MKDFLFKAKLWFGSLFALVGAYPVVLCVVVAIVWLMLIIGFLRSCGGESEPTLNKQTIERQNEIQREADTQIETQRQNAQIQKEQSDARLADAADNTNAAKTRDYSNKSNKDLSDELEKRKQK